MSSSAMIAGAAFAAGVSATALYIVLSRRAKKPSDIKVTYFDILATPGEKLRLALMLTVGKGGFTDERIKGSDWPAVKEARKPKYGQMPIVSVDGNECYQSGAVLRYVGANLGDGSLYPVHDAAACMRIEEMLGLADDLQRAFTPAIYVGMRPAYLGYPTDWPDAEKQAKVKALRDAFVANELPKYMEFLTRELQQTGAFIAGPNVTIADCQLYPQLVRCRPCPASPPTRERVASQWVPSKSPEPSRSPEPPREPCLPPRPLAPALACEPHVDSGRRDPIPPPSSCAVASRPRPSSHTGCATALL